MKSGIYQLTNQVNGNRYIGSSVNPQRRWRDHLSRLRHGYHGNQHLQNAFNKYGERAFSFCVLETAKLPLIAREQYYLDMLKPEYNIAKTAGSAFKHTPEARRKMSQAKKGERHPMYGKRHSNEARAKMSAVRMGRPISDETRAKISASLMGHPVSDEVRRKMSGERNHNFGKHPSAETRAKIGAAHRGKHVSKETRAKISAARKAHWRGVRAMNEK